MKTLYFDCFSGISGDMTLAAFLDLGVDEGYLRGELEKLNIGGYELKIYQTEKNGISAKKVDVICEHSHEHRHLSCTYDIIDGSSITDGAKKYAKEIFLTLAAAEAKVHNTSIEAVHFHEVGAVDSIIDIIIINMSCIIADSKDYLIILPYCHCP